jgi:hypothetical protein
LLGGFGFLLACRWDAHKHLSLATIHLWHRSEPSSSFETNEHRRRAIIEPGELRRCSCSIF